MIYRVMKGRLKNRIRDKIEDVQKYTYWCLSFARRNLTRFVAILNFFDYTMSDPSRNIANACIFNYPRQDSVEVADIALEGCYTIYDSVESVWTWRGKVAGNARSKPYAGLLN